MGLGTVTVKRADQRGPKSFTGKLLLRVLSSTIECPVDRRSGDAEQLRDFGGGVLVTVVQVYEVLFLSQGEFRPLPA